MIMALAIDASLKPLGFERTSSNELAYNGITQKILTYTATAVERN